MSHPKIHFPLFAGFYFRDGRVRFMHHGLGGAKILKMDSAKDRSAICQKIIYAMNKVSFHWFLSLLVAALGLGMLSGCTSESLVRVQPWERATLADYTMRPDRDPLTTVMAEHIYFSREAASGGRGVGGSGCGCN